MQSSGCPTEETPMFTRQESAEFWNAQSACYTCGRVADVIDTGVQIEGEGVLALCTNCVKEMASVGGMDPEAANDVETMAQLTGTLSTERDAAVALNKKLRTQLRESRAELQALRAAVSPG